MRPTSIVRRPVSRRTTSANGTLRDLLLHFALDVEREFIVEFAFDRARCDEGA